jgi:hypothetical protein
MSSVIDRLSAAFADRNRSDRDLGEGGMASACLAEDGKNPAHLRTTSLS